MPSSIPNQVVSAEPPGSPVLCPGSSDAEASPAVNRAADTQATGTQVTDTQATELASGQAELLEPLLEPTSDPAARRIQQLEQALDQALSYIDELRLQVQNQHLLETQLANTEDYASVQQQAILRLKAQLAEQQQELNAQILETQQRDQAIHELLATIEAMTQSQQREVERLRSRLVQDQRQVQTHRSQLGKHLHDLQVGLESRQRRIAELEAETVAARLLSKRLQNQLEGAQQQIRDLSARLSHHQLHLAQIETQLEQAQSESTPIDLSEGESAQTALSQAALSQAALSQQDQLPQTRSADPIPAFAPAASAQRWQQQEIGAERDWLQTRVSSLEQQVAELQEQVLQQAQQKTEDETAMQYWKDRYRVGQAQLGHLKDLAQLVQLSELSPGLQELLLAIQILPSEDLLEQGDFGTCSPGATPPDLIEPLPHLPPRLASVELPEFLVRRRPASESCAAKTS